MRPEAFVFDAYGTLFDVHSVAARCETCWPGKGAQLSQLWRAKQLEYTWQRSLMQRYAPFSSVTRDALAYACEALALELSERHREGLMAEYLKLSLFPDVPQALEKLGKKQAILSNGSPDMLEPLVKHSGLRFDAVISVDELRVFKPAPQIYELAVKKLGLEKSRIVFVSSNCWDALGAKSYGFAAYWINRLKAPLDRLDFKPEAVLTSLGDLAAISK
jgi:2-haloacid dehalogenase